MNRLTNILITLTFLISSQPSFSSVIYVDIDAAGLNSGTSWTNAYTDIQPALDAASAGDQIWVSQGTYYPTEAPSGASVRDYSFHFDIQLDLYGGFDGTETLLNERDATTNLTFLSGDIGTLGVNTDNCYHVLITAGITSEAIIDGFTIKDGYADTNSSLSYSSSSFNRREGAGTNHILSDIRISNCIIEDNVAIIDGQKGGASHVSSGSLTIENSTYQNNSGNFGGAIYAFSSTLRITLSNFISNDGYNHGGAIFWDDRAGDIVTIDDCSFDSNIASHIGAGRGGAIRCDGQSTITPIINNCLFLNNHAGSRGGAIENNRALILKNSTICGNTAQINGGAIFVFDNIVIDSCTIINNSVEQNNSNRSGGINWWGGTTFNMNNCIVWYNKKNTTATAVVSNIYKNTNTATYINCNIEGSGGSGSWNSSFGTDNTGNTDIDPMIVSADCGVTFGNPLPIELIDFTAEITPEKVAQLKWKTASEINNDFFTVEKSRNGLEWSEISTVRGAGNSTTIINYSSIDLNPYNGISYYRLKQTDFDGQFEYSQTRSIVISMLHGSKIELYPNPTFNTLILVGDETELENISVHNIMGQNVTTLTKQLANNKNELIIDMSQLSPGTYFIKTKTTANKVYKQ